MHSEDYFRDGGQFAPMSGSSSVTIFSVWDGDWAILEEYDANGARVQGYVQGYHGLVKTLVDNVYYYQDELGSMSHIANSSGQLLEYYKYDLYGKPTYWSASNSQLQSSSYQVVDLGNGGSRWLPELGLYDDRNRFMSPDLGRFLQPDPIGFKGDASNLYRYCGNDWANKTDPLGTQAPADDTMEAVKERVRDQNGHDFQSSLSAWERGMQVSVDAHSVENRQYAANEAHEGAFHAEVLRAFENGPKLVQAGQGVNQQIATIINSRAKTDKASSDNNRDEKVVITDIYGRVYLLPPHRSAILAHEGSVFNCRKTSVKTDYNSRCQLNFPDRTIARLTANRIFSCQHNHHNDRDDLGHPIGGIEASRPLSPTQYPTRDNE